MNLTDNSPTRLDNAAVGPLATPRDASERPSRTRIAIAFAIAAVSDAVSFWTQFVPPIQWGIDLATAFALFLVLGKRWAILPGLVTEAIPGMAVFPIWILVVLSITVYDGINSPARR